MVVVEPRTGRPSRLAAHYLALGLQPGDRVASLMPNRTELVVHYLACFKAGLVATPLNYRYTPPEIDHALEVSGARILLAHAERAEDIAASKASQPAARRHRLRRRERQGTELRGAASRAEAPAVALPEPGPDAPAAIFFTSGSTGPAKGVTHTHESLGWMIASAALAFELTPHDVFLPGSSLLAHRRLRLFVLSALSVGGRVVVARGFDGDEMLPLLREHQADACCRCSPPRCSR